jgi:metal-responsive CopG/Arc/MetJ family transcriptional regulator
MKVAVSIPDEVFADAELLAKRLKITRSEVYSRALHEFLGRHVPERSTQLMNRVVLKAGARVDPFSPCAAQHVLKHTEW